MKFDVSSNDYFLSCCGAGTAADMEMSATWCSSNMELHRLYSNRKRIPVIVATKFMSQYLNYFKGSIHANFILGGVDGRGPHLHQIFEHGSTDKLPFATLGSGCLASMCIFESRWKPDMNEEDGKKLVRDAIASGIRNDLGSGSNVDLVVIRQGSSQFIRPYEVICKSGIRKIDYTFQRGTTGVLSVKQYEIVETVEEEIMETD